MEKRQEEKFSTGIILAAIILVIGAFAPMMDSSIVNVAIKAIAFDLKSTIVTIQWIVTGYLLAMGLAVPVSGWAIKRFGGKHVYLFSLGTFLVGAIGCALSWNISSLIGFRLLQGMGTGLLMPTLMILIVQLSGRRNLGRLIAIIGIPSLFGPILGPVIGGIILNSLSWRWIFYIDIPISAIAIFWAWLRFPSDKSVNIKEKLDVAGLLLLSPAFAVLLYGIVQISSHKLDSASTLIPILIGIALMVTFVVYALFVKKTPVLDLRLFKLGNFRSSVIMTFINGMIRNGILILLPLYYQLVQGKSVLYTGLLLLPQGIGLLITRMWIGKLADRIGPRYIVVISLVFTVLGLLPFAFAGSKTNWILLSIGLLIEGMAANGLQIPVTTSSYIDVKDEQVPDASIAMRIFQTIGGAFGAAILITVVQDKISSRTFPTLNMISSAYNMAFWWAIGLVMIAFVPALFLAKNKNVQSSKME